MKKICLIIFICFSFFYLNAQTDSIDVQHYNINLDINNTIKNKHKGYLIVESTPNKGSKFTIKLPK